MRELEGEDGDRTLGADLALAADPARLAELTANQRAALAYRTEQKALARGWAAHVGALQRAAMEELSSAEQTV